MSRSRVPSPNCCAPRICVSPTPSAMPTTTSTSCTPASSRRCSATIGRARPRRPWTPRSPVATTSASPITPSPSRRRSSTSPPATGPSKTRTSPWPPKRRRRAVPVTPDPMRKGPPRNRLIRRGSFAFRRLGSLLSLCGHGGSAGSRRLRVEVAAGSRGTVVLVELVDQRDARGDVQRGDVVVADVLELLHQTAQRVAVRGLTHGLACHQVGHDRALPVGQQAVDDELERVGARHLTVDTRVPGVVHLAELTGVVEQGRGHIEGAAPQLELLGTELLQRLRLVLALQSAVVALVEAPGDRKSTRLNSSHVK